MRCFLLSILLGVSFLVIGCNSQSTQSVKPTEAIGRDGTSYNPQTNEELAYYETPVLKNCPGCSRWKAVSIVEKPKTEDDKIVALFELMKKPSNDGKGAATIPENIKLLNTGIENGVLTLNLNDQVKSSLKDFQDKQLFVDRLNDTMILNFGSAKYIKYEINGVDATFFSDVGGPVYKIR